MIKANTPGKNELVAFIDLELQQPFKDQQKRDVLEIFFYDYR